jgi:hypothetical protein
VLELSVSSIPKTEVLEDEVILRRGFNSENVKELRVTNLGTHLIFSQNDSKNVDMFLLHVILNLFPIF